MSWRASFVLMRWKTSEISAARCPLIRCFVISSTCAALFICSLNFGRLEILRRDSFHVELAQDREGRVLLRFLRCLESKRVRLVDQAWQRAIGESLILACTPMPVSS